MMLLRRVVVGDVMTGPWMMKPVVLIARQKIRVPNIHSLMCHERIHLVFYSQYWCDMSFNALWYKQNLEHFFWRWWQWRPKQIYCYKPRAWCGCLGQYAHLQFYSIKMRTVKQCCLLLFKEFPILLWLLWTDAQWGSMYALQVLSHFYGLFFSQDSSTKLYIKPSICSSTYPHPLYTYMDANCAQQHLEPHSVHIGACVTLGAPPGSGSFMITCSHTATLGANWLFLGLAVGCIMIWSATKTKL